MPVGVVLHPGAEVAFGAAPSGSSTGAVNQDACRGAVVHLKYVSSVRTARRTRPTPTPYLPRVLRLVAVIVALLLAQRRYRCGVLPNTTGSGAGTAATATLAEQQCGHCRRRRCRHHGQLGSVGGAARRPPATTCSELWPGGATTAACNTSPSAPTSGTTCTDTPTAAGTYTYTVVAVLESWTATGGSQQPGESGQANVLVVVQNP